MRQKWALPLLAAAWLFGSACGKQEENPRQSTSLEAICTSDADCPGEQICVETQRAYICVNSASAKNQLAGVSIAEGITDVQGNLSFQDPFQEEPALITVSDLDTGERISGAHVKAINGREFKIVLVQKVGYLPVANPFPHYSRRRINMVPKRKMEQYAEQTIFDYHQNHDPNAEVLADFISWAKEGTYNYVTCISREELLEGRNAMISLLSQGQGEFFTLAHLAVDAISKLMELGMIDDLSEPFYRVYTSDNITEMDYLEGVSRCSEMPSPTPSPNPSCTPATRKICYEGNVWHIDSCNRRENIAEYCAEHCEEGKCVDTVLEDLMFSLQWEITDADLNLYVRPPNADCEVSRLDVSCGGGTWDRDSNSSCLYGRGSPLQEIVRWNAPVPKGVYQINVYFRDLAYRGSPCSSDESEIDFVLEAIWKENSNTRQKMFSGTVQSSATRHGSTPAPEFAIEIP